MIEFQAEDVAAPAHDRRVAKVLLDSTLPQLDHLYDYAIPESLAETILPGQRVKVPFRSSHRDRFGFVIEITDRSSFTGELAAISQIVSPVPVLTPQVWALVRTVADRAGGSANDILRLAIPARQVRVEKQHLAGNAESRAADDRPVITEQEANLATLISGGARLSLTASHGPVRLETGEWVGRWAFDFARTALAVHASGRSVIIVVPDYRDLDQVRDTLIAFGHRSLIRVDSRQTNAERYAGFLQALDAEPRIILGNRSAVYAPASNLGAILVWDDGDPVLSEPLTPYVHARDAALIRGELEQAGILLAGHTRSAEVQRLIDIGYVQPQRRPPVRTRIVHTGSLTAAEQRPGRIPELATRVIREGLTEGPVLVQVASPGYAPIAVCTRCGDLARCRECEGPIGFERASAGACRWCGRGANGWQCSSCHGTSLQLRGAGSERTVEQFQQIFPETKVILSDGAHPRSTVDARPALVVATRGAEPLAAGGYRAVVLLDVERLLGLETLRAGEDCLRWWENAAALAHPTARCVVAGGGGPVVQAFLTGRAEEWLRHELGDRVELRYPPAIRVASVSGGRPQVTRALETLNDLGGVDVLGPTEVSEERVRAIVRFEYAAGAEVAKRLRAALIADAVGPARPARGRTARPGGGTANRRRPDALRLRFDDRGVFDEE